MTDRRWFRVSMLEDGKGFKMKKCDAPSRRLLDDEFEPIKIASGYKCKSCNFESSAMIAPNGGKGVCTFVFFPLLLFGTKETVKKTLQDCVIRRYNEKSSIYHY